jgi:spore maturation protein CgeB
MVNFLIISQLYKEIIDKIQRENDHNFQYGDVFEKTINFSRGQEFSFYFYLKKYFEVDLVYFNFDFLQNLWLRKYGESKKLSKYEILELQIEKYRPEIIYLQNIYYFDNNFFNSLKKKFPFIKKIIIWICSPITVETKDIIFKSDLVLTCNKKYFDQLKLINKKTLKINHAIDERNIFNLKKDKKKNVIFSGSVFFKKNYHQNRLNLLYELKSQLSYIDIYSNLSFHKTFENFFRINDLFKFFYLKKRTLKPLFGIDYFMNLSNYKICVNTHLDNDDFSGNMRLFEGTGLGCCLVTNYNKDINQFFEEDNEIITYKNKFEAIEKIKWLLNNKKKLREISLKGQLKTLKKYNYKISTQKIYDNLY